MTKEKSNNQSKDKKFKILKIIGLIFAGLVLFLALAFYSITWIYPSILRSMHKINTPNGIDSMEIVEIGGISQALYFRGEDINNPVILSLHGGPGAPDMLFVNAHQRELEPYFTFVSWDQRSAGKTFYLNDSESLIETLSFELVLNDAYEVTQYIRERLGVDQIIISGHSWGSVLGSALALEYPEYFSAYIGIGQLSNFPENEMLAYQKVLELAQASGKAKHIAEAEALGPPPSSEEPYETVTAHLRDVRVLLAKHGFNTNGFMMAWLTMTSPYYSLSEKLYYINPENLRYQEPLVKYMRDDDFDVRNFGTNYQMPVFYIMGEHDYVTSYQLSKELFEDISAPHKEFFTIQDAMHFPQLENKKEYHRVLLEEILPFILD
jgi:pimeloyl-ACP methyl ester carboxylesterase